MTTPDIPQIDIPQIDVTEAARRLRSGQAVMLDVREDDEWAAGRVAEATHMALSQLRAGQVPTDRPVMAMCRSGNRSGKAAIELAAAGVDVSNVTGGMKAWEAAGLPVVIDGGAPGVVP